MNKELHYQGKKIFYRNLGTGKPVFLIHGFGEDGEIWKAQAQFLKEKCQLIIPDLPGSGQSEMIDDMSIEGMAEVIFSIIQSENIQSCTLIGHSMGGYITLAFAEKYPHLLKAIGLFHSTAFPDNEEKKALRQKSIDFIKGHGPFGFLKTTIPNLFCENSREQMPATIKELINRAANFSEAAIVSYYTAMKNRPDRIDVLHKTDVPVLFVIGEFDYAIPLEESLKQCHIPVKSYIHILHKTGHMGMLEETEKCNQVLESFLKDI
ncbi:MAG: alpha/beta hydrolase [Chitinophagaceae bacterium]